MWHHTRSLVSLALGLVTLTGCAELLGRGHPAEKSAAKTPDEGILGPLHRKHQGEIVFAGSQIPRDGDESVALQDHFRADEAIWPRAFLKGSIASQLAGLPDPHDNCRWSNRRLINVIANVDGGADTLLDSHDSGEKSWDGYTSMALTTEDGPIVPTSGTVVLPTKSGVQTKTLLLFATLADGTHTIAFRQEATCVGDPKIVTAKGEIKVDVDAKSRAALATRIALAPAVMKEPSELKSLEKAARNTFSGAKMLDFRVLEPAWNVERSELKEPLRRNILALSLLQDGGHCTLRGSKIVEENEGGGRYGQPVFEDDADVRLSAQTVPCGVSTK